MAGRGTVIVDTRFVKPLKLETSCPVSDLIHTSSEVINRKMYARIRDQIKKNRTDIPEKGHKP